MENQITFTNIKKQLKELEPSELTDVNLAEVKYKMDNLTKFLKTIKDKIDSEIIDRGSYEAGDYEVNVDQSVYERFDSSKAKKYLDTIGELENFMTSSRRITKTVKRID